MEREEWLKEKKDYLWNYFQLHAGQRMSLFNFFVLFSSLLTAGLAGTFKKESEVPFLISFCLASGLIIMSFTFWKLDQRVRHLIKLAEKALKEFEKQLSSLNKYENLSLFSDEEYITNNLQKKEGMKFWNWHLSYSNCFGIVYILFASIGVLGFIATVIAILEQTNGKCH